MFLPLILAILLGLVNPANHNTNCNGGGTVYVNSDDPGEPGNPGDGDDDGEDGPGSSGDNGQLPPPKPKP